ncbi:hypothetical protein VC218_09795 [Xanthomonas nasturtii]|uniref:hypothetical protein n=1 Tax=Xanthomonas nasturtii TaxID=1843581 RepID=UPI002B226850|nr:hypothetical protein [Xanthomonas nasturtii]MEA9579185.1 hypothetical protein [Xanthomonas nasturtii]
MKLQPKKNTSWKKQKGVACAPPMFVVYDYRAKRPQPCNAFAIPDSRFPIPDS